MSDPFDILLMKALMMGGGGGGGSTDIIADEYNASSQYAVGDYCVQDKKLYVCTTPISVAEPWTAAHWDEVTVGEELSQLNGNIADKVSYTSDTGKTSAQKEQARLNIGAGTYSKPATGVPKTDLAAAVQASLDLADGAEQGGLGITGASVGQYVKVNSVDGNGKPTSWGVKSMEYTLTVTCVTQDQVTVTGQTVTIRQGGASGTVYATAAYNGQPVSFLLPVGFVYHASVSDTLSGHFNPTTSNGIITMSGAVTLTYSDFSNIHTARDVQVALDLGLDLTGLVGRTISCSKNSSTLVWEVTDYDNVDKVISILLQSTLPDQMPFEPAQATAWYENGLPAGNYSFMAANITYYFTLPSAIPSNGQLRVTETNFYVYSSPDSSDAVVSGAVSTTEIVGATNLGTCGVGAFNHMDRVKYGSNNSGESALYAWLNSDAPANTPITRPCKFSRRYAPSFAGFLNGLDPEFLSCISDTAWTCQANSVYEAPASVGGITTTGSTYTVTTKFGLASRAEVTGGWDLYVGATAADRIKYYNGTARHWWLRSSYGYYANNESFVFTNGVVGGTEAHSSFGVVPACKIRKSTV